MKKKSDREKAVLELTENIKDFQSKLVDFMSNSGHHPAAMCDSLFFGYINCIYSFLETPQKCREHTIERLEMYLQQMDDEELT